MSEPIPVELRENGTVRFSVGDHRITLRRVKLGEWETLREAIYTMDDDIADAAETMREASEAIGQPDDPKEKRAATRARKVLLREFQATNERLAKTVVSQMFDLLADPKVDADDIEPWMASADFISQVSRHLQSVPLGRGGS